MKITRKNAIELNNILSNFDGTYNKTFSMYLVLNSKKLTTLMAEVQDIQTSSQPKQELLELQQKEVDLLNEYVEKGEDGKPIILGQNNYKLKAETVEEYNEKKKQLLDDNKDVIDEFETLKDNVASLLDEEIELDLISIPFECVPDEIDVKKLEILSVIIKDFGKI